ncbi:MAG: hypothetical protein ABL876_09530 [Chitinophagaceae bacterium]
MENKLTIQKHPELNDSSNYELLRQKGMEHIEQMGSQLWTDFNIHDPGITVLELLCYAITDLGYRTSFDIKDILASPLYIVPVAPDQALYTARDILTTSPWTNRDYRKLLIDIDGVKNAWLTCRKCPCNDLFLYADCKTSTLRYTPPEHPVIIKGLYDVMIEFEEEEGIGDLNSGKIKYNFSFLNGLTYTTAAIEMRLFSWKKAHNKPDLVTRFMDNANYLLFKQFIKPDSIVTGVTVDFIAGTKNDNIDIPAAALASRLRKPVYATMKVKFKPNPAALEQTLQLNDVALTVWFRSDEDRRVMSLADLKEAIEDASAAGIVPKYLAKIKKANDVIKESKRLLHEHRNLCEDYCSVKAIEVDDIGICGDLEVEPDADIEAVLAEIYFLIDQYFSPDIRFYSLQQLLNENWPVDEIFDGPKLENGFIKNAQLDSTNLKKALYASDVINLVMDVPGVKAIKNFAFTKYDDEGFLIKNESWEMEVTEGRQPRLYIEASKFLVFKNGLPFLPDKLELADTLQVIKGQHAQPKFSVIDNDLPVPKGTWYNLKEYFPLQYSLPLTYGTGFEGLPPTASPQRKAQAKQLKAYLLFYEQILVNYLEQLSHVKDLFSLTNTTILDGQVLPSPTYYSGFLDTDTIKTISELYPYDISIPANLSKLKNELRQLNETETTRLDRKNRFLDHLLARFAEQFNEYALMLYSYVGEKAVADDILIKNKIAFLKDYPFMSYYKARSFNYKDPAKVCTPDNVAGLTVRIRRLLGVPEFAGFFELYNEPTAPFERRWRLMDEAGNTLLKSNTIFTDAIFAASEKKMKDEIAIVRKTITTSAKYEVKQVVNWIVNLLDAANNVIATTGEIFTTQPEAEAARDAIIDFAGRMFVAEKILIVEHLLLRPRNKPGELAPAHPGDTLLPICIKSNCDLCGDEDPYSFRFTLVLNGEEGIANSGIEFRRFAEQTIRLETPAHLGLKICWVSKEQLTAFEALFCDWLKEISLEEPDELLLSQKLKALIELFIELKNVYPPASLHDCVDGNDDNRVYLNQTIISNFKPN